MNKQSSSTDSKRTKTLGGDSSKLQGYTFPRIAARLSIDVDKAALANHLNAAQESARVLALAQYDIDSATTPESLSLARVHLNDAIAHARKLFQMALDGAVILQGSDWAEATRSTL